jgi:hypothetical protein
MDGNVSETCDLQEIAHETDDPQLGIWVQTQRQVYNNTGSGGILTKKRLELLNSINFTWPAK